MSDIRWCNVCGFPCKCVPERSAARYAVVHVTWLDSALRADQCRIEDLDEVVPVIMETVGWLVRETPEYLVMSLELMPDQRSVRTTSCIPVQQILERRTVAHATRAVPVPVPAAVPTVEAPIVPAIPTGSSEDEVRVQQYEDAVQDILAPLRGWHCPICGEISGAVQTEEQRRTHMEAHARQIVADAGPVTLTEALLAESDEHLEEVLAGRQAADAWKHASDAEWSARMAALNEADPQDADVEWASQEIVNWHIRGTPESTLDLARRIAARLRTEPPREPRPVTFNRAGMGAWLTDACPACGANSGQWCKPDCTQKGCWCNTHQSRTEPPAASPRFYDENIANMASRLAQRTGSDEATVASRLLTIWAEPPPCEACAAEQRRREAVQDLVSGPVAKPVVPCIYGHANGSLGNCTRSGGCRCATFSPESEDA